MYRIPLTTMKNLAGTYYLKQFRHGKKLYHILEDSPYIYNLQTLSGKVRIK